MISETLVPSSMTSRKRRYCLTLNNPTEEETESLLKVDTKNIKRMVFGHEVGESGTPHLQGFIHLKNATTISALKRRLGSDRYHLEATRGTDFEAWTYCTKDGDVVVEFGEQPTEEGELSDWEMIAQMVKDGSSNLEIIERYPAIGIRCQSALDRMRLEHDRANAGWRDVEVTFITGPTGCGKTRTVMDNFGYANVYRCTDKKHPFETYAGQDVIVFEEFRNGFARIEDMLNWLDGYPVELPARYANKLAKFTKVYILTNVEFDSLYPKIQRDHPNTWEAFKRRITTVQTLY